ncbi:hypothetical protein RZS08_35960, partial [Arthrospira platensis SPKY1]|nr:hypothetical protein [Arthrospira platensis SPKY1]
ERECALTREHAHDQQVTLDETDALAARDRRGDEQAGVLHVAHHAHEAAPPTRCRWAFDLQAIADRQPHVLEAEAFLRGGIGGLAVLIVTFLDRGVVVVPCLLAHRGCLDPCLADADDCSHCLG